MAKTKPFDKYFEDYEKWFEKYEYVYKTELKAIEKMIDKDKNGIEIGVGSGRFSGPLGIKTGVEPSENMAKIAKKLGIKVIKGTAENLPIDDNSFDFALLVTTICFVDDVKKTLQEIKRILKKDGYIVIGFVDVESPIGKFYLEIKNKNKFYKDATFFSTKEVLNYLEEVGFQKPEIIQTVFGNLDEVKKIQQYKEGYGEGSFVVIKSHC